MVDRRSCTTWTQMNLSYFQSIFVQPAHKKILDQSQSWHNRIGWRKGKPNNQVLPPQKTETEQPPGSSEEGAGAL